MLAAWGLHSRDHAASVQSSFESGEEGAGIRCIDYCANVNDSCCPEEPVF